MYFTLGQAAKETGKHKSTILKAIDSHRMSAKKNSSGQWDIEPSELFRLYPKKAVNSSLSDETVTETTQGNTLDLEHKIELLKKEIEHNKDKNRLLEQKADSLEDDRNHWRKQAETVTLLLETDKKKYGFFDLFSKK